MIPYGRQSIDSTDIDAVVEILKSDYLTQGPTVGEFEKILQSYTHAPFAIAVSNGTTALHLAYSAIGISRGDAVFIPAITFAATANAVVYCGGTPIFVDVDSSTGLLSTSSLAQGFVLAKAKGLKPRAVTTVHLAGNPHLPWDLIEFCKENRLSIIEDACHALGAEVRYSDQEPFTRTGFAQYSDAVIFSFHPVKHIATGEGGAVLTQSAETAAKIKLLRSHGITKEQDAFQNKELAFDSAGRVNPWYYEQQLLGFNYRISDIAAALGLSQMKRLDHFLSARRELAAFYRNGLRDLPNAHCSPPDDLLRKHAYHIFPLKIDFKALGKTRAEVMKAFKELGIGTQVHYLPVPWHPYYRKTFSSISVPLPGAESYYAGTLSIPMYPDLLKEGKESVLEAAIKILK